MSSTPWFRRSDCGLTRITWLGLASHSLLGHKWDSLEGGSTARTPASSRAFFTNGVSVKIFMLGITGMAHDATGLICFSISAGTCGSSPRQEGVHGNRIEESRPLPSHRLAKRMIRVPPEHPFRQRLPLLCYRSYGLSTMFLNIPWERMWRKGIHERFAFQNMVSCMNVSYKSWTLGWARFWRKR